MMRNMQPILFAMILLALGSARASTEADGPYVYRVTRVRPDDVLNIRAAPKADAAKLDTIPSAIWIARAD